MKPFSCIFQTASNDDGVPGEREAQQPDHHCGQRQDERRSRNLELHDGQVHGLVRKQNLQRDDK